MAGTEAGRYDVTNNATFSALCVRIGRQVP